MNVMEKQISGTPMVEQQRKRPIRMVRWFIIVTLLLGVVVGGLVYFNYFRARMITQFFANNKPPPVTVSVADAKSEVIPNLLTAVGDLAAVHQVNVTSDVSGRITDIMFTGGSNVEAGKPPGRLLAGAATARLATVKSQATRAAASPPPPTTTPPRP